MMSFLIGFGLKILWVDAPKLKDEKGQNIKNLHVYDYNLFWMNIRQNMKQRINTFYKHR